MRQQKIKLLHIITGLDVGGAEIVLYNLLANLPKDKVESLVISLIEPGPIAEKIKDLGIPVISIKMKRNYKEIFLPQHWRKLIKTIKLFKPNLVHTWMYHANFMGGLAAKFVYNVPIIWAIHHSNFDLTTSKETTIWTATLCAHLSRWIPTLIISCSNIAKEVHLKLGYHSPKIRIIPNGTDLAKFRPNNFAYDSLRKELGLPNETKLVGLIARFDPQKDHYNFIAAAGKVVSQNRHNGNIHFVLCGKDITWENKVLRDWINSAGITPYCHLLGQRNDINQIIAGLDVCVLSSSYGEAFPNIICEAMASEVPCVVTDVGDSRFIIDNTGIVVPPRNPDALANGILFLLSLEEKDRKKLGKKARERIAKNFSVDKMVKQYLMIYEDALNTHESAERLP